jgi:nicotinamide-nucleotide amidase
MADDRLTALARQLGEACRQRGRRLALAESCTAGGACEAITRIPGSSAWFDRGFVTYSNEAKIELLGVREETLRTHGAVSSEAAREMVLGAIRASRADTAVAITGIAGPEGGSVDKPVGLVWLAWCVRGGAVRLEERRFAGDREAIRTRAVEAALRGLLLCLDSAPG